MPSCAWLWLGSLLQPVVYRLWLVVESVGGRPQLAPSFQCSSLCNHVSLPTNSRMMACISASCYAVGAVKDG
jgi:hypothetical protein